jgi:hypothetical protein
MELQRLVKSRDNLVRTIKPCKTGRPSKEHDKDYNIVRKEDVLKIVQSSRDEGIKLKDIIRNYQNMYNVKPRSMNVSARLSTLKRDKLIDNNFDGQWYAI